MRTKITAITLAAALTLAIVAVSGQASAPSGMAIVIVPARLVPLTKTAKTVPAGTAASTSTVKVCLAPFF